jgi:hypothetical protein
MLAISFSAHVSINCVFHHSVEICW